jgi:hypothetical protein
VALYNETLAARFNRVIQRLHSMKGPAPAPQVSPEIIHDICLEVDRPEFHFLHGGYLWVASVRAAAGGAGTFASCGVANPATVGLLVVVQGALVDSDGTATSWFADLADGAIPAGTQGQALMVDTRGWRSGAGTQPTGVVARNQNTKVTATAANQAGRAIVTATVPSSLVYGAPWVLGPGAAIDFLNQTANNAMNLVAWGYARALEENEGVTQGRG